MGRVRGLFRYPVKSAGGEALDRVEVTSRGLVGDRVWACVDADGVLVSAKHPRRGAALLTVTSRYDEGSGRTILDLPESPALVAGQPEADEALSVWLGRRVRLTDAVAGSHRLRRSWPGDRALIPDWERTAEPGAAAVTEVAGPELRNSFVDYGAVHIITTAAVRALSAVVASPVDPLRFRPNVTVDTADELQPGMYLRIGQLRLRVEIPTPRCVVPGLSPVNGSLDRGLMRALARHERRHVLDLGTAACFGVYAVPEGPGSIRIGAQVEVL